MGVEIESVPFADHPLQAGLGVGRCAGGSAAPVDVPAADRPGAGVEAAPWRAGSHGPRLQRAEHPIAVAAAGTKPFHLHMPVVPGAVRALEVTDSIRLGCIGMGEQQQFHPVGSGAAREKFTPRAVIVLPIGQGLPRWIVAKDPARATQDALPSR